MTFIPASLRARVVARAQESCEYCLVIAALDPQTASPFGIVPLFNPRKQPWHEHFRLNGPVIVPLSASGRATERLLELNQIDRVLLRQELIAAKRYPFRFGAKQP